MKPSTLILAIVLTAAMSLLNLIPIPVPVGPEGVPLFVARLALVLGALGLVAALGLWLKQNWAKWLTLLVMLANGLSAAPGLAFAPTMTLRVLATLTVVISALTIWLLVRRPAQPTLA